MVMRGLRQSRLGSRPRGFFGVCGDRTRRSEGDQVWRCVHVAFHIAAGSCCMNENG